MNWADVIFVLIWRIHGLVYRTSTDFHALCTNTKCLFLEFFDSCLDTNYHSELRCCAPFPKLTNVEHINHMCMKSVWIGYKKMCNIYFGMPFFFHSTRNRPSFEERKKKKNKYRKNSRTHIKYIITILYIYFSTVYQCWRFCALQNTTSQLINMPHFLVSLRTHK